MIVIQLDAEDIMKTMKTEGVAMPKTKHNMTMNGVIRLHDDDDLCTMIEHEINLLTHVVIVG